jgi:hypothetical protein
MSKFFKGYGQIQNSCIVFLNITNSLTFVSPALLKSMLDLTVNELGSYEKTKADYYSNKNRGGNID